MNTGNKYPIPVVMYHTVGEVMRDWEWSYLTVPFQVFESHLQALVKAGYQTVDLYELQDHVSGRKVLHEKCVVLTFDDGYLDNWGYVAPLLSKYGLKGVVFVNPEFVDPRDIVRPTLHDVWQGTCKLEDIPVRGFMSWPELRSLTESGSLSIQSHGMSHTWYPISDTVVDFYAPGSGYYWLDWNLSLDKKSFYLEKPDCNDVPVGMPVYEHGKSLAVKRFFPASGEVEAIIAYAKERGEGFYKNSRVWKDELYQLLFELRESQAVSGRFETDSERLERYRYELEESKRILEERLGAEVDFLCWPGGGYNSESQTLALEYYSGVTLGSADKSPIKNEVGDNHRLVRRIGVPGIEVKGKIIYPGGQYLVKNLDEYRGVKLARRQRQLMKAITLFRNHLS